MNRTEFYTFAKNDSTYTGYDSQRSSLANQALEYAFDWHVQNPKTGTKSGKNLRQSRKECKVYIRNKFKENSSKTSYSAYGFILPSWILYLILNAIINWAIRRLLDHWLFKK